MLTEMQVKNAKARERDYKLADSEGLYLYVTAKGHRSWRMKYRFAGKERRLVLGVYPDLGLRDGDDVVPYSTQHVGKMAGGVDAAGSQARRVRDPRTTGALRGDAGCPA